MPLTEPHDDNLPQEESVAAVRHPGEDAPTAGAGTVPEQEPGTESELSEPESEPRLSESEPEPGPESEPEPTLPEPVRQRIVALTAAVLPV
ncbi:hypothetical protein QLR68_32250, partial [Micromonospora sp. DH15]|nr:hypothetical protein [Micromonospora sp. DH15]